VKKGDRNVFGKVPDLASGFRGGASGFQTFARAYGVRMADHWETIQANIDAVHVARAQDAATQPWALAQIADLEISEAEWIASETCKLAWRARHPATVALWAHLQEACHNAVQNPNTSFKAGRWLSARCVTHKGHEWLLVKLPSGRYLTYFEPKLVQGDYGQALTYMADASEAGSTSRQWRRTFTHGGKLTANATQTLARDLLVDSITRAEEAGYEVVLSVHDELIAEVPDSPSFSADGLGAIMATVPAWAPGLPLAAAGFETDRYRKE
jgi:DNA polymerase